MWRSRSSKEWERKKTYLIRSLFEDIPVLSPILEVSEPASLSSPSNYINRAESPLPELPELPELIIEVEPKKLNLHDDPEELYDELAKEMWRMYRKDFLGIDSSSENSSSESLNRGIVNITFDEFDDDNTDEAGRSESESFAKDTNASNIDSSSERSVNSLNASPEIMRQRPTFLSFTTPLNCTNSKSNSTVSKITHLSMEVDSEEFYENVLASNQEIEIAEGRGSETVSFVTSTPTRKRTSPRFSTSSGHKRRLISYSPSSSFSIAADVNAASQTSFSDCETDYNFFWSNFFKGIPKVYNVCSCNDHVCTT